jgi:hypothetical protein
VDQVLGAGGGAGYPLDFNLQPSGSGAKGGNGNQAGESVTNSPSLLFGNGGGGGGGTNITDRSVNNGGKGGDGWIIFRPIF